MSRNPANFPLKDYYSDIHSTYDRVNRLFTFGRDVAWRKKAVFACLEAGPVSILDVCTGTGDFILEVARQLGRNGESAQLSGYDFNRAMLQEAQRKLEVMQQREQIPGVMFREGDVGNMPFGDGSFDAMGITFGLRNLLYENSHADRHLQELYRVLKPGGRFIILESSKPANVVWRLFNNIYLRFFLPLLGGAISGNLKAYLYLARSSRNYYTIREMGGILQGAGFRISHSSSLFLGSVMLVVAEK